MGLYYIHCMSDPVQCKWCGHSDHQPGLCWHIIEASNTGFKCCQCGKKEQAMIDAYEQQSAGLPPAVTPSGTKHDSGKPPMELLDPDALEGLARVLEFGAKKYSADNWRGGIAYRRIIGAILRHTFAIVRGRDTDHESGLPAVDHLLCEAMFLSYFMKHRPDLDDRWKEPKK